MAIGRTHPTLRATYKNNSNKNFLVPVQIYHKSGALFHLTMVVVVLVAGHHLVLVVLLEMTIVVLMSSDHFRQIPHHVHQFGQPINKQEFRVFKKCLFFCHVSHSVPYSDSRIISSFFSLRLHILSHIYALRMIIWCIRFLRVVTLTITITRGA